MRIEFGWWVCTWCGSRVDLAFDRSWRTEVIGAAGTGNIRVVIVDGVEVHRCDVGDHPAEPMVQERR